MTDHLEEMSLGRCPMCGGRLEYRGRTGHRTIEYACQGCRMITEVEEPR